PQRPKSSSSGAIILAVPVTLNPRWRKISMKLTQTLGFARILPTLTGEAMSAITIDSWPNPAKISWGETLGVPSGEAVASQHKTDPSSAVCRASFMFVQSMFLFGPERGAPGIVHYHSDIDSTKAGKW